MCALHYRRDSCEENSDFWTQQKKQLLLSWLRMMNSYLHVPVCSRDKSAMLTVPRLLQAVFGFSFYWSHSIILIISSWQTLQTTCRKLQHTSHTCGGKVKRLTRRQRKEGFFWRGCPFRQKAATYHVIMYCMCSFLSVTLVCPPIGPPGTVLSGKQSTKVKQLHHIYLFVEQNEFHIESVSLA